MRWWAEAAVACAYIGAVIGAGFASGQELAQFFLILGPRAIPALLLTTALFALGGFFLRSSACRLRTQSYRDLVDPLLGRAGGMADAILIAFLFGTLVIMLAGAGAVVQEYMGVQAWLGSAVAAALTLAAVAGRSRGVLVINGALVPVLVAYLFLLGLGNLQWSFPAPLPGRSPLLAANWVLNGFLYVAYNMVGVIVLFTSLPAHEGGKWGAFCGGLILGFTALVLVMALGGLEPAEAAGPIPVLSLVRRRAPSWEGFYVFNLWIAMATSAVTSAFGLAERLAQGGRLPAPWAGLIIVGLALPASGLGFARLVAYLYPFFGYVVLLLLVAGAIRQCFNKLGRQI
ncbi:YkvI family membrane protein [Thermanaeromonas sp. C210]|uniref:YkvI family membrane protein n=1 Tax=Thermanaeromonas sp. C210 TaxID=2731925 RepID=UPI00155CFDF3|nr:hypothetical protein [Thermanaeromonas sp. C210]GFN23093.1 transporter [Thermanaeromonas sp. C210]